MKAFDLALDDNDDLLIEGGDFAIRESDQTHVQHIIDSHVGYWKQFPALGVGMNSYQNSSGMMNQIAREVKLQLENDGYRVDDLVCQVGVDGIEIKLSGERI